MSHGGVTEGSECLPADDNSAARLMSELSPRLQPLTTSFDNSLRRRTSRKLPGTLAPPLRGVHGNHEQASRAYSHSVDTSDSACSQSPHSTPDSSLFPSVLLSSRSVRHSQSLFITPLLGSPTPSRQNLHRMKSF